MVTKVKLCNVLIERTVQQMNRLNQQSQRYVRHTNLLYDDVKIVVCVGV